MVIRSRSNDHHLSSASSPTVLTLCWRFARIMEMTLNRTMFDGQCTEGSLSIGGQFQCYTLELPNKDGKPGSCIPQGRYRVVLAPSPKFESSPDPWVQQYAGQMPHLEDIPGRSLIMIHWGNDAGNTEGCILVGKDQSLDYIDSSRAAFMDLYEEIQADASNGDCWITVVGGATVSDAAAA